jgi:L-cysteine S-thiosulfotransferase
LKWKMLTLLVPLVLSSCSPGPKSSHGFRLPDGDAEAGMVVFEEMACVACHTVEGAELTAEPTEKALDVRIGGKALRVRTYGELVTAVINPSHRLAPGAKKEDVSVDGKSLMVDSNQRMTVQQLIDVVAFLQSTYVEHLPQSYDPGFP